MNKCFLKGNVGHTPRITTFQEGGKIAQFTLATTERGYTRRDGKEVPEQTTWHNIVVNKTGLAEVVEKYVTKGTPLLIMGRIQNRKYIQKNADGNAEVSERTITEIVAEEMELLGRKEESKSDEPPAKEPTSVQVFPEKKEDDLPF